MHPPSMPDRSLPGRLEATVFYFKTRCFILRRWVAGFRRPVKRHPCSPVAGEDFRAAEASSPLWTQNSAEELPLTAGKVQNLRAACRRLDGMVVPAAAVFSFWKQLGRTTRGRGYTTGRELRSGCLVPALGGGLCQLSGLLHEAALKAGLEIVERHAHSRTLPGAELPPERDATVFWNYVDLRFRAPFSWSLEVRMTHDRLVVKILSTRSEPKEPSADAPRADRGMPVRASATGDCLTCGMVSCFRHPSATRTHAPDPGHAAWLLDGTWPEFREWCRRHSHPGDRWLTPLDGSRWKKPNYAWNPPPGVEVRHAMLRTLWNAFRQRRLPSQGAVRQRFLLSAQRALAEDLGRRIDPLARHLVVSQTLLPHLWLGGHLGGRTFDVLVNRWPMEELHARLDAAAKRRPESGTLADFRADPALVRAEREALAAAGRLITPHRAIARSFGSRAVLLDWQAPQPMPHERHEVRRELFFPASPLGRKGVHDLAEALRGSDVVLRVLGRARENGPDPLEGIRCVAATPADLDGCAALVIPAWIEHEPRLALLALASGIPVIASRVCGLPAHPLLREIEAGDAVALRRELSAIIVPHRSCAVA